MYNSVCVSLRAVSLVFVASVCFIQSSTATGSTLLRGENRTCRDFADLDHALDHPGSLYFKGWRTEDFEAAQAWVEGCLTSPPTKGDTNRQALLTQRRASMESRGEIRRNDEDMKRFREGEIRDEREREAELKAEESVRRAEETDRKAKQQVRDECERSNAYQRYVAGTRVLEALDRESEAQQALERERRVESASGTTNLYTKRNAGEALVAAQDDLNKWWALFQHYGGDAKNPRAVPRSIGNPCT